MNVKYMKVDTRLTAKFANGIAGSFVMIVTGAV